MHTNNYSHISNKVIKCCFKNCDIARNITSRSSESCNWMTFEKTYKCQQNNS